MSMSQTGYFRPADSKEAVNVSRSTVYRWKQAGLLKAHKVGGLTFFKIDDVKQLIDGDRQELLDTFQ